MTDKNDEKAIDAMADAMLGGFSKGEKRKDDVETYYEPSTNKVVSRSRSDTSYLRPTTRVVRKEESHRTTSGSHTLHTTSKSTSHQDPYTSVYDPSSAPSQASKPKVMSVSPLRDRLQRLKADDAIDLLKDGTLMKKIEGLLLDELERRNWLLLGQAEAFMFRQLLNDRIGEAMRAFLIKLTMADVMRDNTKPKS